MPFGSTPSALWNDSSSATDSQWFYRTGRTGWTSGGVVMISSGGSIMRWDRNSSYVR